MKKALRWMDQHFEEMLMAIFLCGVVVMMTTHVFFRYVLRSPLTWSEEATRYMFIWFVFVGVGYGIRNDTHIRVNIIEVLCPKAIPVFSLVQDLVTAAFCFYMTPASFTAVADFAARSQTSAGLHLPMQFVYGALLVGILLGDIRVIQKFYFRIYKLVKGGKKGGEPA